jgi:hypothetical protein
MILTFGNGQNKLYLLAICSDGPASCKTKLYKRHTFSQKVSKPIHDSSNFKTILSEI